MAMVLALTGVAYGHCVFGNGGLTAAAAHAMPSGDRSPNAMAVPHDCDGCDHMQTAGDACLAACVNTVALPPARDVGVAATASQPMAGAAAIVLAGIYHPPDPHPPKVTVLI